MLRSAGAHQDTACRKFGNPNTCVFYCKTCSWLCTKVSASYLSLEKLVLFSLVVIKDSRGAFEICNRDSLCYLNRLCYPERCRSPISSVLYLSAVCRCPWYLGCVVMANTHLKETGSPHQMTPRLKFILELWV